MSAIYIKEQGALVQKSGERLIITKNGKTLLEMPVLQAENISLIGNVQITAQPLFLWREVSWAYRCRIIEKYFSPFCAIPVLFKRK